MYLNLRFSGIYDKFKKRGEHHEKKLTEQILCAVLIGLIAGAVTWLMNGFLRLLALAVLYFVELDVFVSIVKLVLKEPELPKNPPEARIKAEDEWYLQRQDPARMPLCRRIGWGLHGVAFAAGLLAMIAGISNSIWAVVCLGCSVVSLGLCMVFPAFFSLGHLEGEKGRRCTFPIVNLMIPAIITPALGALTPLMQMYLPDWGRVMEVWLLLVAVLGVVLRLGLPELRRDTGAWCCVLFLSLLTCFGYVFVLNRALDPAPQTVSATVVSYEHGGVRNPADYTMELENGEMVTIELGGFEPAPEYRIGERIELEYHHGGLGIEYYTYADQ